MKNKERSSAATIRRQAMQALKKLRQAVGAIGSDEQVLKLMFQELQLHQTALEMQNDELRIVNEELELQRIKLAGIYNLAPVGYFILNEEGVIDEVNNAGYRLLVGGKARLIGKPFHNFVPAGEADGLHRFFNSIKNGGQRQSLQLKMEAGTGYRFDAQVEGIGVRSAENGLLQFYIGVVDITESIKDKQHLSQATERLELALQTSGASIWELDTDTMRFQSEELSQRTGFLQTYLSFIDLLHPDDQDSTDQHFRWAINQHREVDIVCRIIDDQQVFKYYRLSGHVVKRKPATNCFVGMMVDITELKRTEEETIRLKQDQQKALARAMLSGQENAGKRISDALHDGVSQLLYGVKMKLGTLKCPGLDPKELNEVYEMLNLAIAETRNISFELAPSILTDFGLVTTLEELAKRFSTPAMKIKTGFGGMKERLNLDLETGIFRIVQELINNCMKHSHASLVLLQIKKNKTINIIVKDNGQGFLPDNKDDKPKGAGLSSIRNRVNLYNGTMHIDSAPGNGTTIQITIPLGYGTDITT